MKSMTIYESGDGSRWDDPDSARARDDLILVVDEALRPLGETPPDDECKFANGYGYVQHSPEVVAGVREAVLSLTRKPLAWWIEQQGKDHGKRWPEDFREVHPSWYCRLLEGSLAPLVDAWVRLWKIDGQGREWGQPYFADHPYEARGTFEIVR